MTEDKVELKNVVSTIKGIAGIAAVMTSIAYENFS
jgi:hypothetical protein